MVRQLIGHYDPNPDPWFKDDRAMLISDAAIKSVVFLGIKEGGRFRPRATAFVAQYTEFQYRFDQLVTAEHVVSGLLSKGHDIWVRINMRSGQTEEIKIEPNAWRFHPNNENDPTDVAICPFTTTFENESGGFEQQSQWSEELCASVQNG